MNPWMLLSPRETQILENLAQGKIFKEVGYDLGISETTVAVHVQNIRNKVRQPGDNSINVVELLRRFYVFTKKAAA
jgi:DNA-binding NarL/FixJ family response regulator